MYRILAIGFFFTLFVSCKHDKAGTNSYKDAKTHPSETIAKEQKKASDKADHDFKKNQRKNKKSLSGGRKGSKIWNKKKYKH